MKKYAFAYSNIEILFSFIRLEAGSLMKEVIEDLAKAIGIFNHKKTG
ncbi:hypothetical protein HMPREF0204_12659 [Chryseobacterium gleum ATCC 35910]|uniref:Uncharacterized protein n=1 Tax=Chryseobacterium gleum ATCC 35910 TaxID=525257 RepID=A0ABP2IRF3_CHRGE|nr:hypothetical protein HMPREF0204_12659 [Chryseobacterium gleum ATCC 35910]